MPIGSAIRVLHSSDLHGNYADLLAFTEPFDLWLDSGDFFPNLPEHTQCPVDLHLERDFEAAWLRDADLAGRITAWLRGRPALILGGNHDYVDLCPLLEEVGAHAQQVVPTGVEALGLRWAGFRHVKWLEGYGVGEIHDFSALVAETFAREPDVLVTHGPPATVLESDLGFGIPELTAALQASERVIAHFFGHDHRFGGESAEAFGVRLYNGAKRVMVREI